MYKILFIDEQKDEQSYFLDYIDRYPDANVEVEVIFPCQSMDEMIDAVININPDAIVSDFRLNEYKTDIGYNVPYNGVELAEKFQSIRDGFPCFIITSFDNDAIPASEDVNIVYVKSPIHNPNSEKNTVTFLDRVKEQIKHYKTRISNAETELQRLLELKKKENATLEDEARIIELDGFLENAIDKRTAIPTGYKSLSTQKQLSDLMGKVDELINKLESK